ncbi:MAG: hypothetical protein K2X93_18355 [Candidatus Obscuribacterales bacterium]|nr:hypothetical protein [Candidatus Obscuribacterales bacterium]
MQDSVDNKLVKLVAADYEDPAPAPPTPEAAPSAPTDSKEVGVSTVMNFSDRALAEAVIKKLSTDEFLQVMEGSSADELNCLLKTLDAKSAPTEPSSQKGFLKALFEGPTKSTTFDIIGWWEARRLPYNILVGIAGIVTLLVWDIFRVANLSSLIWPAIAYGIIANVCYTSGWMAELLARRLFKEKAEHFGPILFAIGLLFSMLITFGPSCLVVLSVHL